MPQLARSHRDSLRTRIVAPILGAVALLATVLTVAAAALVEEALTAEAENTAVQTVALLALDPEIATDLAAGTTDALRTRFAEVAGTPGVRGIAAYVPATADGERTCRLHLLSGEASLPESIPVPSGTGSVRDPDAAVLRATAPVQLTGGTPGAILLEWSLSSARATVASFRTRLVAIALVLLGFCALATNRTVSRVLARVHELLAAMARVTNGHLGERLDVVDRSELGVLAQRFNMMSKTLEENHAEIAQHAALLERRVDERTAELQRANDELRTLDAAKDAFLSNVSHEMRTPLTSIVAAIEILRDHVDEDREATDEFLGIVHAEAGRLSQLIGTLLDIARLEAQSLDLDLEEHDLTVVIDDAFERNVASATGRGVALVARQGSEPVRAAIDRPRIDRTLDDLIDNAIKFSPKGATVELELVRDGTSARIVVRDEGPGIAPERVPRVFEKFSQAGAVLTDKPQGVGLGLALGWRIARAHAGELRYVDDPAFGAVFELSLPLLGEPRCLEAQDAESEGEA